MNIDKQLESIGRLLDSIEPESLTEDERDEFLLLTEKITSDIERVENVNSLIERLKAIQKQTDTSKLASTFLNQLKIAVKEKVDEDRKLANKDSPLTAPTPFDNN